MASITKLKDRKGKPWQVRIRRKGKTVVQYFKTKREASDFAAKVEADFDKWSRLLGGELKKHSLADLIDRYIRQWSGKDHNTPSRLAWWREHYGERSLAEFNDDTVREAIARLKTEPAPHGGKVVTEADKPRSGPTVNRYKAAISAAYKTAIDGGWFGVKDNPVAGIRAAKEHTSGFGQSLSDKDRPRLLQACDASTLWPALGVFVRLALATGARRGELLKLTWADVDLKRGSILLRDTKNGDDRRVPLIGDALKALKAHAKVRRMDDARVFPGRTTETPPQVDKAWHAALTAAEIDKLRIHDLRHSCGSYLARAGLSAFQIAAILGHRSGPQLTARYVHLHAEESRELMEGALAGVLGDG